MSKVNMELSMYGPWLVGTLPRGHQNNDNVVGDDSANNKAMNALHRPLYDIMKEANDDGRSQPNLVTDGLTFETGTRNEGMKN